MTFLTFCAFLAKGLTMLLSTGLAVVPRVATATVSALVSLWEIWCGASGLLLLLVRGL